MKPETRQLLLESKRADSSDSWLEDIDHSSLLESQSVTRTQTVDMLRHAYGIEPTFNQELKVHVTGDAAKTAGVGKALENVQTAIRALFAEKQFGVDLQLVGVEPGSTILVFEPVEEDLKQDKLLESDRVLVTSSANDRAIEEALVFLKALNDNLSVKQWEESIKGAKRLARDLVAHGLEAEFAWYPYRGSPKLARFTERSSSYLERLDVVDRESTEELTVTGVVTEVTLVTDNSYKVKVSTSSARNARKREVLVDIETFKSFAKFVGDRVSWLTKRSVAYDQLGRAKLGTLHYLRDADHQATPALF